MRAVVQRVTQATVDIAGERVAAIGPGLLVLVGVHSQDSDVEARQLAAKIINLRIFADEAGKMNRSAVDLGRDILIVSQFTLYGDVRKGRRPSFVAAGAPEIAAPLVDLVAGECRDAGLRVAAGVFGADMQVSLVNDGPVTIWIDTADLQR